MRHDAGTAELLDWLESERRAGAAGLDAERQRRLGQYFTPAAVAVDMAAMLRPRTDAVSVLDPGAGVGVLAAAAVVRLCGAASPPESVTVTAYEVDDALAARLSAVLERCASWGAARGVAVDVDVRLGDFIADASTLCADVPARGFDAVILNPPYGKIAAASVERQLMRALGVEVPNVYAAFWAAALAVSKPGGDVVAITPRSFCNGTYFRRFREWLLDRAAIRQLHMYDKRDRAFVEDGVLQENLITHLEVGGEPNDVTVSAQPAPGAPLRDRVVPLSRVVHPHDPERFLHVVPDSASDAAAATMSRFGDTLGTLGLTASTGKVVDFRARELLRADPEEGAVPLIYPGHMKGGATAWPRQGGRKANAIEEAGAAGRNLLVPDGDYVLVKRFSAKEERRRVVPAFFEGDRYGAASVGFENHVNYLHAEGAPLARELALGLVVYLGSTFVDDYFRQFSGHTQVNAGDLRTLRYPAAEALKEAGAAVDMQRLGDQTYVDRLADGLLLR